MDTELVYPVYSRRSQGISIGIDLFPDAKHCSFNCPYCEVHPFFRPASFSVDQLKRELISVLSSCKDAGEIPSDIAFAGHGEPLLSPHFMEAARCTAEIKNALLPEVPLVLITNSLELGRAQNRTAGHVSTLDFLEELRNKTEFHVWAKLDAGTPPLFYRMSGLNPESGAFEIVKAGILALGKRMPLVIQTMLAQYQGIAPEDHEIIAYAELVKAMLKAGANFLRIDLYTVSRKPITPLVGPLSDRELLHCASIVSTLIPELEIRVFGKFSLLEKTAKISDTV